MSAYRLTKLPCSRLCIISLLGMALGCSGNLATNKERAVQEPVERNASRTSTDQQQSPAGTSTPNNGSTAGGEATRSDNTPRQTASSKRKQRSSRASDDHAIQPNNVAGAFLVKPVLRNCLRQTLDKTDTSSVEESEAAESAQETTSSNKDIITLCGITFLAEPAPNMSDGQVTMTLAGSEAGGVAGEVTPVMLNGSLSSVRVMASTATDAIARASQNLIAKKVAVILDDGVVVARTTRSFKLDERRWVVYGRAETDTEPAPDLAGGGIVLEYTPVAFTQQRPMDLTNFSGTLLDAALTSQLMNKGLLLMQNADGSEAGLGLPKNITSVFLPAVRDHTALVLRLVEAPLAVLDLLYSDAPPTTELGRFILGIASALRTSTQSVP